MPRAGLHAGIRPAGLALAAVAVGRDDHRQPAVVEAADVQPVAEGQRIQQVRAVAGLPIDGPQVVVDQFLPVGEDDLGSGMAKGDAVERAEGNRIVRFPPRVGLLRYGRRFQRHDHRFTAWPRGHGHRVARRCQAAVAQHTCNGKRIRRAVVQATDSHRRLIQRAFVQSGLPRVQNSHHPADDALIFQLRVPAQVDAAVTRIARQRGRGKHRQWRKVELRWRAGRYAVLPAGRGLETRDERGQQERWQAVLETSELRLGGGHSCQYNVWGAISKDDRFA